MRNTLSTAAFLLIARGHVAALRNYCTFGNPCWPSAQEWAVFNASVSGRLISVRPPAAPCHDPTYDAVACSTAQSNWAIGNWRADQPGAYQQTNWENGDAECFITSSRAEVCEQGLVPVLAVAAETVDDIQRAVKFAGKKNLHLVVKNTGHDYLGRSSGAGSFSIWIHRITGIEFANSFRSEQCLNSVVGVPAVTVQAGETWIGVYQAAHDRGVVVVGGGSPSVGAAGGYVLGGGHSPISYLHGMAVDNVLQYTVVKANGQFVKANPYINKGLFWALRGGGGSNWGVVTSVTYKTHAAPQSFLRGILVFRANDSQTAFEFHKLFFEFVPSMVDSGFRAYPSISSNLTAITVFQANSPGHTGNHSIANSTFAPLFDWVAARPPGAASLSSQWITHNSFLEFFPYVGNVSLGSNIWLGSRIITQEVFVKKSAALAQVCMAMRQFGTAFFALIGGGAVYDVNVGETPLHPAWRVGGLASLTLVSGWPNGASLATRQFIQGTITNLTQTVDGIIGGGAGSYANEADPLEPKWKQVFWGLNYDRLLSIKHEVDPTGVFTCNRCVGSDL